MSAGLSVGGGSCKGICEVLESTLRITVNNVSKLERRICSVDSTIVLRGIPFRVLVEPVLDKVRRHTTLGVFLQCDYKQTEKWSCKVGMKIALIVQKKDSKNLVLAFEYTFSEKSAPSWGFPGFILWSKLVDPVNAFLVNDAIVLDMKVSADSPEGVQLHNMQLFAVVKPAITTETVKKTMLPEVKYEEKNEDDGNKEEEEDEDETEEDEDETEEDDDETEDDEDETEEETENEEENDGGLPTENGNESYSYASGPGSKAKILQVKHAILQSVQEKLTESLDDSLMSDLIQRNESKEAEERMQSLMRKLRNIKVEMSTSEKKMETETDLNNSPGTSGSHGSAFDEPAPSSILKETVGLASPYTEPCYCFVEDDSQSSSDGFEYM